MQTNTQDNEWNDAKRRLMASLKSGGACRHPTIKNVLGHELHIQVQQSSYTGELWIENIYWRRTQGSDTLITALYERTTLPLEMESAVDHALNYLRQRLAADALLTTTADNKRVTVEDFEAPVPRSGATPAMAKLAAALICATHEGQSLYDLGFDWIIDKGDVSFQRNQFHQFTLLVTLYEKPASYSLYMRSVQQPSSSSVEFDASDEGRDKLLKMVIKFLERHCARPPLPRMVARGYC